MPILYPKCTCRGVRLHVLVISQWFGCLGQGQVTFLNELLIAYNVRKMYMLGCWAPFSCDFSWFGCLGQGQVTFLNEVLGSGKCTFQGCWCHFPVISQWFGCLGQGQVTFLYPTYCQQMYRRWTWKTWFFLGFLRKLQFPPSPPPFCSGSSSVPMRL